VQLESATEIYKNLTEVSQSRQMIITINLVFGLEDTSLRIGEVIDAF